MSQEWLEDSYPWTCTPWTFTHQTFTPWAFTPYQKYVLWYGGECTRNPSTTWDKRCNLYHIAHIHRRLLVQEDDSTDNCCVIHMFIGKFSVCNQCYMIEMVDMSSNNCPEGCIQTMSSQKWKVISMSYLFLKLKSNTYNILLSSCNTTKISISICTYINVRIWHTVTMILIVLMNNSESRNIWRILPRRQM